MKGLNIKLSTSPFNSPDSSLAGHGLWSNSVTACITHLLGLCTCPNLEQEISVFICFQISLFFSHDITLPVSCWQSMFFVLFFKFGCLRARSDLCHMLHKIQAFLAESLRHCFGSNRGAHTSHISLWSFCRAASASYSSPKWHGLAFKVEIHCHFTRRCCSKQTHANLSRPSRIMCSHLSAPVNHLLQLYQG